MKASKSSRGRQDSRAKKLILLGGAGKLRKQRLRGREPGKLEADMESRATRQAGLKGPEPWEEDKRLR